MGCAIKIVPDAAPNADGEWINIDAEPPQTTSWIKTAEALASFVPEGYHLVSLGGRTHDIADPKLWS